MPDGPTPRWTTHRPHEIQRELWSTDSRRIVALAGRRSGKTEILGKRRPVREAIRSRLVDGWFWILAPTIKDARRIYWRDLRALIPRNLIRSMNTTELTFELKHGPRLTLAGTEDADSLRGNYMDGVHFDEADFMKDPRYAWEGVVRPMLSTEGRPPGWASFGGTPDGRGFLWELYNYAIRPESVEAGWMGRKWTSEGIVNPEELAEARRTMDPRLYRQEFLAEAMLMSGRAYYEFETDVHARLPVRKAYNPTADLDLSFDFNRSPGSANVTQQVDIDQAARNERWELPEGCSGTVDAVIGEVHIPRDSTTPAVCRRLIEDWGKHQGRVTCYGDPTGGAKGTAKVEGSDWDLIERELRPVFGERLRFEVERWAKAGDERRRVNALNARFRNADGEIHCLVDPGAAPMAVRDFEGVAVLEGGTGEIDKSDQKLTHWSDGLGYRAARKFPLGGGTASVTRIF